MKKFVTFIAPVYNVNKYLGEFLDSFLEFPKDQYEVILIDDCGDDDPTEIADGYKDKININLIKLDENMGQGFARNKGLKSISKKATHFMMIDPDDVLIKTSWNLIGNASDTRPTLSKKFIMFDKVKSKEFKIWRNNIFKGSGVSVVWGHLFPGKFAMNEFTSGSFEDQKWMAGIEGECDFFETPIVKYRNRKSSTLNVDNTSAKKSDHISLYMNELNKAEADDLIKSSKSLWWQRVFSRVEYLYIPKRNRKSSFPTNDLSNGQLALSAILGTLERVSQFWWFYDKFNKKNFFD